MSDLQRYMSQSQAYMDSDTLHRMAEAQQNTWYGGIKPENRPGAHYAPADTTRITGPKVRPPDGQ